MRRSAAAIVMVFGLGFSASIEAQELLPTLPTATPNPAFNWFSTSPAGNAPATQINAGPAMFEMAPVVERPQIPSTENFDGYLNSGNCPSCPRMYAWADALYWHRVGTGCDEVLV